MKTVLFVPGYPENINSRDYSSTMDAIRSAGFAVEYVPINWRRTTLDQWVTELDTTYSRYDPSNTIIPGFSFGAMTALVASTKRNPYELWLFSLSPYFAEDLVSKNMRPSWLKQIGHRRVDVFKKYSFKKLADQIRCKVLLFGGQAEMVKWPGMNDRIISASELLQDNVLITIPNTGHDVADRNYINAIKANITCKD